MALLGMPVATVAAQLLGSREAHAGALSNAWEALGGGPSDLFFPSEFLGRWTVRTPRHSPPLIRPSPTWQHEQALMQLYGYGGCETLHQVVYLHKESATVCRTPVVLAISAGYKLLPRGNHAELPLVTLLDIFPSFVLMLTNTRAPAHAGSEMRLNGD
jgi:hypothetical protein